MTTDLYVMIARWLESMTHADLDSSRRTGGLAVPRPDGFSKRQRIQAALGSLTPDELARVGISLAADRQDDALDEAARKVLEENDNPLTTITRRDVARIFGADLGGERTNREIVAGLLPVRRPEDDFLGNLRPNVHELVARHMDDNPGDWSVEQLFAEIGAFDCSIARFGALLEAAVHPLSRSGETQARLVADINDVLARDRYALIQEGDVSGHAVYVFRALVRGVEGRPKNLIFASRGPKPEIGFRDAINNDVVLLSGEENCLIYDRPIAPHGLLWSELVAWWSAATGADAQGLGARLGESLASDAERKLFATYFKSYRQALGDALPALLPQVYLHYDPAIVKSLRGRLPLPRQRMDFLLLLPSRQRVVLEVDGKHHFSKGEQPSLRVYADMVSADRELRLAGYEIYRFGANELVGEGAEARITDFFDRLFRLHNVGRERGFS